MVIELEEKMGYGQVAGIYAKAADLTKDNLPYWVKSCAPAQCKGGNKAIWGITSPKYGQFCIFFFFFLCVDKVRVIKLATCWQGHTVVSYSNDNFSFK